MQNWRDQMVQQVKGERNHPSVMLWSLENEWLFINCINLYGGLMDQFEAEVKKCSDAVQAVDPTRLTMTDGGGANKDQSMPVHGNHYVFDVNGKYPDLAYEANPTGGGRGRWTWDRKRPRFIGEDYFATGINPFDYAYFGGEETFRRQSAGASAQWALVFKMLTEGYRWAGQSAWHHWVGPDDMDAGEEKRRQGEEGDWKPDTRHPTADTLQLPVAPRRVLPSVGLDIRQRAEGEAHTRHLQRHARPGPDHSDVDIDGGRQKGADPDDHAHRRARRQRKVRRDARHARRHCAGRRERGR